MSNETEVRKTVFAGFHGFADTSDAGDMHGDGKARMTLARFYEETLREEGSG
jgi:hypothetical protein